MSVIVQTGPAYHVPVSTVTVGAPVIRVRENYPAGQSKGLGIFQIICGSLAVILAIMGLVWGANSSSSGYGFWCGAPMALAGVLGVLAGANKRSDMITAYLVASIISLCVAGLMGLIAIIAISVDRLFDAWSVHIEYHDERMAVDCMMLLLALLLGGSFVWSTVIAGNCCQTYPGHVNSTAIVTTQSAYSPPVATVQTTNYPGPPLMAQPPPYSPGPPPAMAYGGTPYQPQGYDQPGGTPYPPQGYEQSGSVQYPPHGYEQPMYKN